MIKKAIELAVRNPLLVIAAFVLLAWAGWEARRTVNACGTSSLEHMSSERTLRRRETAKSGHSPTIGERLLILNGDIQRQLLVGMEGFELQLC